MNVEYSWTKCQREREESMKPKTPMRPMKVCKKCGEGKVLLSFYKKKRGMFGVEAICKACHLALYRENKARVSAYYKMAREANPEKFANKYRKWQIENPGLVRALANRHRAAKLRAKPVWANEEKIKEYYELAAQNKGCHVDHIVPLQSKIVCGLHNEFNLQILNGPDNAKKGNRFWPGMP